MSLRNMTAFHGDLPGACGRRVEKKHVTEDRDEKANSRAALRCTRPWRGIRGRPTTEHPARAGRGYDNGSAAHGQVRRGARAGKEPVKAGKLPKVEERLPKEPMVIKPVERIGDYGGSWMRVYKSSWDTQVFHRVVYDPILATTLPSAPR